MKIVSAAGRRPRNRRGRARVLFLERLGVQIDLQLQLLQLQQFRRHALFLRLTGVMCIRNNFSAGVGLLRHAFFHATLTSNGHDDFRLNLFFTSN